MGLECYRSLPTLRHFLLIAQDRVSIDPYSRDADGRWVLESANRLDAQVELPDIGCVLPAAEVYAKALKPRTAPTSSAPAPSPG